MEGNHNLVHDHALTNYGLAFVMGVALVAALAIRFTDWLWLDPMVSLIIVAVIAIGMWGLLRESLNLALDAVPEDIHPTDIEAYLAQLPGIKAVAEMV